MCAACTSLDPVVQNEVVSDVKEIFSQMTIKNAKMVVDLLPKALDEFAALPPEEQADGF
jgi:DNA-directed RNA polymerase subunit F